MEVEDPDQQHDDDDAWLEALAGRAASDALAQSNRQAEVLRSALQRRKQRLDGMVPVADEMLYSEVQEAITADRLSEEGLYGVGGGQLLGVSSEVSARVNQDPNRDGSGPLVPAGSIEDVEVPAHIRLGRVASDLGSPPGRQEQLMLHEPSTQYLSIPSDGISQERRRGRWAQSRNWLWGGAASVALATVLSWNLLVDTGVDESQVLRGAQDTVLIDPDPSARLAQLQTLLEGAGSKPEVRIEKSGTVVITVAETPQVLDALTAERIFPQPVGGKIVLVIEKPAQRKP